MDFLVWQLIDSNFPSGGFAHSAGLEAAVQHGHVIDAGGVRGFAGQALAQLGRSALPLVTAAHRCREAVEELDELCDVFLSNPIGNRASRAQGRALLTAVARSFPEAEIANIAEGVRINAAAGHYAPLFGALFSVLGVDLIDTQRAFLFITLRGVSSAAVRLGLIGAYEAQTIHAGLAPHIDTVIHACGALPPHAIAQTAPLIDLFQSTHDRLYSRLFQS
ncbi:MAG: urease accessory UreF family protein [Vicinamibacterales bacterium]